MTRRRLMFPEAWRYKDFEPKQVKSFDGKSARARSTHPRPRTLLGYVLVELGGEAPYAQLSGPIDSAAALTNLIIATSSYVAVDLWSLATLLFGPCAAPDETMGLFESVAAAYWTMHANIKRTTQQRLAPEIEDARVYLVDALRRYTELDGTTEHFGERAHLYGDDADQNAQRLGGVLWTQRTHGTLAAHAAPPNVDAEGARLCARMHHGYHAMPIERLADLLNDLAAGIVFD